MYTPRTGALGNVIFLSYKIINKGGNTLQDTYVSIWSDPDLGGSSDDLVGCDTTLSLGYCYNATNNDNEADGNVVMEVYETMSRSIEDVRRGLGPAYVEYKTYRWREHCGPNFDNDLGYRTEAEYLAWRKRCPLEHFEGLLKKEGIISEFEIKKMTQEIVTEIKEAFQFAISSPFPTEKELHNHLYAD